MFAGVPVVPPVKFVEVVGVEFAPADPW